jgi:hypothetical protein
MPIKVQGEKRPLHGTAESWALSSCGGVRCAFGLVRGLCFHAAIHSQAKADPAAPLYHVTQDEFMLVPRPQAKSNAQLARQAVVLWKGPRSVAGASQRRRTLLDRISRRRSSHAYRTSSPERLLRKDRES